MTEIGDSKIKTDPDGKEKQNNYKESTNANYHSLYQWYSAMLTRDILPKALVLHQSQDLFHF